MVPLALAGKVGTVSPRQSLGEADGWFLVREATHLYLVTEQNNALFCSLILLSSADQLPTEISAGTKL